MFVSGLSVPPKMRTLEYFMLDRGSKATRKTTPTSGPAGSALISVTFSPSTSLAGSTSAGEGMYLMIMVSSSLMPISWRASVKTIGITVPDRIALTNAGGDLRRRNLLAAQVPLHQGVVRLDDVLDELRVGLSDVHRGGAAGCCSRCSR